MSQFLYTADGDKFEVKESFTCPRCGRTTYNRHDVASGYCGACHWWTGHGVLAEHKPEHRSEDKQPIGTAGTNEEEERT